MRKHSILILLLATILPVAANTRSQKNDISKNLNIFNALYKALQTSYVDSLDADANITTAINAMLSTIDPYTEYYPEDDQEEFLSVSTGEYGGIGSYIQQRPGQMVIVSEPREGSPAAKAGLRPGDIFMYIDEDTVTGWTSAKISNKLKGQPGSNVKITVKRPYVTEDSLLTFNIVREKIEIDPLPYYGIVPDSRTGYINLATFNEKSAEKVKDAFEDLKNKGIESLILDLRGNGGGILEGAVQISSLFLPKGTDVVKTMGRGLTNEKVYKTSGKPVDTKMPMVVLVDGNTASSSEIVTGALQDLDRAVVVGTRSYGKGLVQSSRPLPYNGLLKVTVARYYTPSGRCVQRIDYSHRNSDGTLAYTPDSLTNVFYTSNGREVRDGGGITPDVVVPLPEPNRLVYNIVSEGWDFDFANKYRAENDTVASPDTWVLSDEDYESFKSFINPEKLHYDKVCEMITDELEKAAKSEGYMSDEVAEQIAGLRKLLKHDLNHDFDVHRDLLSRYLSSEIMQRYYFNKGVIIESLRHDKEIKEAVEILNDPDRYNALLQPKKN